MPNKGEENQDEQVSPGSKMSAEYSLDDRKIIDDKNMSNKSPQKQPPPKSSGKTVTCNVYLLDGENVEISLDKNDVGRALFDKVCTRLDLIERDYFGLTYTDDRGPSHLKYWLNLDKKISKQKKRGAWVFEFALKFYPPDPSQLRESLTRWLVVLQIRRDLLSGRIPCTFTTYALLGSYNVQADIGEYDPSDHGHSYDYIKDMAFAPNQTPELLEKIAELHKLHKGQTPDEAEKGFLDNAKKLAMYGIDLHKAKDSDNNAVMIGVCCSGLLIFRDKLRLNRFVWPKILKLSYKRNHFYIKIRPGEMERHETTIMFKLDNHRLAKRLWKTCVEHHAFFRLREAEKPTNNVSFPRFGSKFRYSGRTLYQTRQTAALLDRPPPFFERSQPARNTIHDTGNRSRSMDELGNRKKRDSYDDGRYYDPNRGSKEYDPNKYGDEKDRRDLKGVPTAFAQAGRGSGTRGSGDEDTLQRRPYDSDTADRTGRLPSQGDATLERERGRGHDDSMGVTPGVGVDGQEKPETDKERRKREKEEDKKRKKEAEEKKKKEEEEKKKNKKKKGKGDLDTSEDRTDKLGHGDALETAPGYGPGSAGLDGDKNKLGCYKDGKWHPNDEEDKGYNKDGKWYPYDRGSDCYCKDGKWLPCDKLGDAYFKNGEWYPYDKDNNCYNKDGKWRPCDEDEQGYYNDDGKWLPYDDGGKGCYKNGKWYPYDKDRNCYFKDGKWHPCDRDDKDYYQDGMWHPYDEEDKGYNKDGKWYPYDKDSDCYYKDGKWLPCDKIGDAYCKDGKWYPYNEDSNCYYKNGKWNPCEENDQGYYNEDGKWRPYDDGGKGCYKDGNWYPYDAKSNCYYKDGQWNPCDEDDKAYHKDGKWHPYSEGDKGYNKYGKWHPHDKDSNCYHKDDKWYPCDKDGIGYYKDGKWYPYDNKSKSYFKDGKWHPCDKDDKAVYQDGKWHPYDEGGKGYYRNGKWYPYDKDTNCYYKDGKWCPCDKDGVGYGNVRDDREKSGKDKQKDKKGGGLFGRLKKGKHDEDDAHDIRRGKDGDKGKKGGYSDEPDISRDKQGNLGTAPGFPYGVGLGVGKGDMTGVVGEEKSVDNKQKFMPIPKPTRETKESLKSGYSDNLMPFFDPAATSTVGRGKVPPPVPPKGSHDDSFNYKTEKDGVEETKVVQKVVMSGDEEDDYDFDAALADAIRSVTEFNPDMSVERIECVQQIEDVKNGK